jgi:hypothetical protein
LAARKGSLRNALYAGRLAWSACHILNSPIGGYRVQDRLVADTARRTVSPRHLLTGKIVCGVCGRAQQRVGKDHLARRLACNHGCPNGASVRCAHVEARVVRALSSCLMQPKLLESFASAFAPAWQEQIALAVGNPAHRPG